MSNWEVTFWLNIIWGFGLGFICRGLLDDIFFVKIRKKKKDTE